MTDESAAPAARRAGRTSSAGSAYGSKPAGRKFSDAAGRPFAAGERAGRSGFGRTRTEKSSAPRSRSGRVTALCS